LFLRDHKYRRVINLANEKWKHKQYPETIKLLRKANEIRPDNPSVYCVLADSYQELGEFENAQKYIALALNLDKGNLDYLIQEISILVKAEAYDASLAKINTLPKTCLTQIEILELKGWSLLNLKRYNDAKLVYEKMLDINGPYSNYLQCLSECHKNLGHKEESFLCMKRAVEMDSNDSIAHNNYGYKLLGREEYPKAIKILKRAIFLNPAEAYQYNNLGFAYLKTGRKDLAFKNISHSIKLDYQNSYAYKNLALYYLSINETDKAIKYLETAKAFGFAEMYGDEVDELLVGLRG